MGSKVTIAGHPLHPMLVAYPIAFYTATLAGFVVYAIVGGLFWLKLAIAMNVAGVVMALLAALPGFIDWGLGVSADSPAKRTGLIHMGLNLAALGLFVASFFLYFTHWNGPAETGPVLGIVLSAVGVALTIPAGFQGWIMIQNQHVGVRDTSDQQARAPR